MTTIGVVGTPWRATVTGWGGVRPWDGSAPLDWYVAADDRWHVPAREQAVRQTRVEGTPVVETRLRVPGGDAIQRVYACAHDGGMTVVEVENASSLPFAVAFDRGDLLSRRPPVDVPIEGIELPAGSVVFPVAHRTSVVIALAHDGRGAGRLPQDLPPLAAVVRGWLTATERPSRFVLPDAPLLDALTAARCEAALGALADPEVDPVGFVLGAAEAIRMGERADPWVPELVAVVERLGRAAGTGPVPWDVDRALVSLGEVLRLAHEQRALRDLAALRDRLGTASVVPGQPPEGVRTVAWLEHRLVRPGRDGSCALLPEGLPASWFGASIEAYRLPSGHGHQVSFALRWHGERPALLWEVAGPAGLVLHGGGLDPRWHTVEPAGEALLSVPPGAPSASPGAEVDPVPGPPTSFS